MPIEYRQPVLVCSESRGRRYPLIIIRSEKENCPLIYFNFLDEVEIPALEQSVTLEQTYGR